MKMNHWLILAATLSAGILAQGVFADDQPPANPSGVTPEASPPPAKKKKAAAKKPATAPKKGAASEPAILPAPVTKGPAVVTQKNVNVRGQPAINSEIILHLKRGDHVDVLEIVEKKAKQDEPSKWAKVALPTNAPVWVNATFINAADKTVVPKKLNVRSGPGENYSVIARLTKGTAVKEIETKGDWMKIEAPSDSYSYIAAHLLSSEPASPPMTVAVVEPPKPPPPVETAVPAPITPVAPPQPVVVVPVTPPPPAPVTPPPAPVTPPPAPVTPPPTTPVDTATAPVPPPIVTPPPAPTPPPEDVFVKRIVSREGIVKRTVSIQAPTYFALQSLDTGKMINYLYSPSTNVMIKDYMGKRIIITGEEVLDERWPNTPVINVEALQAVP